MVAKENLPRVAAFKKLATSAAVAGASPMKRKSRPLAELPAFFNAARCPRIRNRAQEKKRRRLKPAPDDAPGTGDDPQLCDTYAADIYGYLRYMEAEERRRPLPDFLDKVQLQYISADMRAILVDWLVAVAQEYKLLPDTLYLAVSYVDRFLSHNPVDKKRLQLLGISSILIASKYEEIKPPNIKDLCDITDNTYNKIEVIQMEASILKFLNFEMGNPTVKTFLRKFMKAGVKDKKSESLVNYLAELSLLDYGCLRFLPSMVAASVVFLARFTMNPKCHPWSSRLQQCTGYSSPELKDCIFALHDLQLKRKCSSVTAVRDKYKQQRFKAVAALIAPSEIPVSYLEDFEQMFCK